MKIKIDNASKDETIFEGNYEYVENTTENNKPSFFVSVSNRENGKYENYEIYFCLDSKEELEKFIKTLEHIKENN